MDLFIFSQNDEPLTIFTEDTGLVDTHYRIEVNSVPDTPFSFTVESDRENAKYIKDENKVVYRDHEGDLRLVVIKELDDSDSIDGSLTTAICEPEFMELSEHIVVDRRFTERTAQFMLDAALDGTRYIGEVEVELGLGSTNFYYLTSVEAIWKIIEVMGGEFKDVVEFDSSNNIVARKIKLLQRLGADTGQRFEVDHNITEIGRTVLSYPLTAMYGRGASLEIEDDQGEHTGGYTRYIDFADVEWKKSNGDPVDKPLGQRWVGDPDALQVYGRPHNSGKLHRYGIFSNQDYEEPEELLWATWQNLQENKRPEVNYRLSVDLFDDKVSLGDTAIAIDRYFSRPIEIQARIIAMEYDLLDIEGSMVVEMGQFLNLDDDRLDELENKIDKVASRPQRVTENSYPDRKPSRPVNVEAHGGIEVIQLYWDYADEIFIKHYEVYGSQVADFVPDTQHLLWRGQVSAFAHAVNTDETWYYYARAVNYHGTASDWSARVSASTTRIISDDILFGEDLAARLRELNRISDIIGENGVDFDQLTEEAKDLINQQARIYTDEEIEAMEGQLLSELDNRIGDINTELDNRIGDVNESIADLINITDGIDGTITTITQDINTIEGSLSTTITELSNLDGVVSEHTLTLNALPGQLNAKAEKSEVYTQSVVDDLLGDKVDLNVYSNKMTSLDLSINGLNTTVSNTQATVNDLTGDMTDALSQIANLDVRADGIEQNVSQIESDFDGRITSAEGSITTLAGQVELKASLDSVNDLTGRVSTAEGALNVLPGQINAKVDQTIYDQFTNSISNDVAQLDIKADGIISSVNSIRIGGRNLIRNSKGDTLAGWSHWGQTNTQISTYLGREWIWVRRSSVNNQVGIRTPVFNLIANKTYMCSFLIRSRSNSGYNLNYLYLQQGDGSSIKRLSSVNMNDSKFDGNIAGDGLRVWFAFNHEEDIQNARLLIAIEDRQEGDGFVLREVQIEQGNMVSGWSPNSDDVDQRMVITESSISQLSDEIDLKVNRDGLVSEINLQPTGTRIKSSLIHLDGLTLIDDGIIQNAHIANLSAAKVTVGTMLGNRIAFDSLHGDKVMVGTLTADRMNVASLSAITANVGELNAGIIRSNNNTTNWNLNTGVMRINTGTSGKYVQMDGNGLYSARGSMSIERADGALLIQDGYLTYGIDVQSKQFLNNSVTWDGQYYNNPTNNFYSAEVLYISHDARYLNINVASYLDNYATLNTFVRLREFGSGSNSLTLQIQAQQNQTVWGLLRIDLGVPTYTSKNFYLEIRHSGTAQHAVARMRFGRMWLSG